MQNINKKDFFILYLNQNEDAARWIAWQVADNGFSTLVQAWEIFYEENSEKTFSEKILKAMEFCEKIIILIPQNITNFNIQDSDLDRLLSYKDTDTNNFIIPIFIEENNNKNFFEGFKCLDLSGLTEKSTQEKLIKTIGLKENVPPPYLGFGSNENNYSLDDALNCRKHELKEQLRANLANNYHMELRLETEVLQEVEEIDDTGVARKETVRTWNEIYLGTILNDSHNYVIMNPSGMGKTVFLNALSLKLLEENSYNYLPLNTTCLEINSRTDNASIEQFLDLKFEKYYKTSIKNYVNEEQKNLCLLIDALDQSKNIDEIISFLSEGVENTQFSGTKIIISSRDNTANRVPQNYKRIKLSLPDLYEVEQYLGAQAYAKLEDQIASSKDLVTIPVLLEMLKRMSKRDNVFLGKINTKAKLYNEFIRTLISQEKEKPRFWQDSDRIKTFLNSELETCLEQIAFQSLNNKEILIIQKQNLDTYCKSQEKKQALLGVNILLEIFEEDESKLVFRHQSFQSYFAAKYIYNQNPEIFNLLTTDVSYFYNDVWQEVIKFYVGFEEDSTKAQELISLIRGKDSSNNLENIIRLIFAILFMTETSIEDSIAVTFLNELKNTLDNNPLHYEILWSNLDKFNIANNNIKQLFINTIIQPMLLSEKEDWTCLIYVIKTLEKIVTPKDLDLVKPLFMHNYLTIRRLSLLLLSNVITYRNVNFLLEVLNTRDPQIRSSVKNILFKIITRNNIEILKAEITKKDSQHRLFFLTILDRIATSEDIDFLISLLDDNDLEFKNIAASIIVKVLTIKKLDLISKMLNDENPYINKCGINLLEKLGSSEDLSLLESYFNENFDYIVYNDDIAIALSLAVAKLGSFNNNVNIFISLLKDGDKQFRENIQNILIKIVRKEDRSIIKDILLKDFNPAIRQIGVKLLGTVGISEDLNVLYELLEDKDLRYRKEDPDVKYEVLESIYKIITVDDIELIKKAYDGLKSKRANTFLERADAKIVSKFVTSNHLDYVRGILDNNLNYDPYSIASMLNAISRIGTTDDLKYIIPLTKSWNDGVIKAAQDGAIKLLSLNDKNLVEAFLDKKDAETLRYIAKSILSGKSKNINIPEIKPLIKSNIKTLIKNYNPDSRIIGLELLEIMNDPIDAKLVGPLCKDSEARVRIAVAELIGKIGHKEDIEFLKTLLNDFSEVRRAAIQSLNEMLTHRNKDLIEILLQDNDITLKKAAARAVRAIYCSGEKLNLNIPKELIEKNVKSQISNTTQPLKGKKINILHISDIHYNDSDWDIQEIFDEFIKALEAWKKTNNCKIDIVCITGDIAASGKTEEYNLIISKIKKIIETAGCNTENLFIIPGNHDVQEFNKLSDEQKAYLEKIYTNREDVNEIILNDSNKYKHFLDKFNNYYHFITNLYGDDSTFVKVSIVANKPWYSIKLKDSKLRIIGLNSSLFTCMDYHKKAEIIMGIRQFKEAYQCETDKEEQILVLTHHPINWLEEDEENTTRLLLSKYSAIHLHGHTHKQIHESRFIDGNGQFVVLGAGSLYGEKGTNQHNTFQILTIDYEINKIKPWVQNWDPNIRKWDLYIDEGSNGYDIPSRMKYVEPSEASII